MGNQFPREFRGDTYMSEPAEHNHCCNTTYSLLFTCRPYSFAYLKFSEVKNSVIFISLTVPATNKRPQHNRAPWIFMSQKRTGEEVGNYIKVCS